MKTQIAQLAAHMLTISSDIFSNHGCNDLDEDVEKMLSTWTDEQCKTFLSDATERNNGPIEVDHPSELEDWLIMDVLAYQLQKYF